MEREYVEIPPFPKAADSSVYGALCVLWHNEKVFLPTNHKASIL